MDSPPPLTIGRYNHTGSCTPCHLTCYYCFKYHCGNCGYGLSSYLGNCRNDECSNLVNISGIPKDVLIEEMWKNQIPITTSLFEKEKVDYTKYIDYLCGRAIKADISGNACDPRLYDRDAGFGTFSKIVLKLKKEYKLDFF